MAMRIWDVELELEVSISIYYFLSLYTKINPIFFFSITFLAHIGGLFGRALELTI